MATAIVGLGIMFFTGHALNWFFTKTKIPDLLILVVIGFVMGPVLGLLSPDDFGKVGSVIASLALIVILYEGGLHLSARDLLTGSLPAAGLSIIGFLLAVAVGFIVTFGLALQSWTVALLVGVGIGSTSSAIVIPLVKHLSINKKTKTILSLESAFTDVLTIVIFLVLIDAFVAGQFSPQDILIGLGPNTLIATFWGLISALIWAFLKKHYGDTIPKTFSGEAWALLTYGVLELSGLNGAIGVLALGFTLANLSLLPQWLQSGLDMKAVSFSDLTLLKEITFLLRTFFFLYLGLLVQLSNWKIVVIALIICGLIFITRYIMVRIVFKTDRYSRLDAMVAAAMGPRGLACAVLATLPLEKGLPGGEWIQQILFAIIPFSILFTAIFVALSEKEGFRSRMVHFFKPYSDDTNRTTNSLPQIKD